MLCFVRVCACLTASLAILQCTVCCLSFVIHAYQAIKTKLAESCRKRLVTEWSKTAKLANSARDLAALVRRLARVEQNRARRLRLQLQEVVEEQPPPQQQQRTTTFAWRGKHYPVHFWL